MTIADEQGKVMQRGGEEALRLMQEPEEANRALAETMMTKVNQLFTMFNTKFEQDRVEEARVRDAREAKMEQDLTSS